MDSAHRTDAEIITASLANPTEFGVIFTRHYDQIYRFVARRIGPNEAGDAASDVFLKAFRIRRRYDPGRPSCLPWLYGIAVNTIGDRIRQTRRAHRIYLHALPDTLIVFSDLVDERLIADGVAGQLNRALSRLSADDRESLLLFALEGLSYSEIGEALAIPSGTVASRLARARRKIREAIPDIDQIADRITGWKKDGNA